MEDLAVDTKVETEEICPIMSSQGFSPVRCRKDCAWFFNAETMPWYGYSNYEPVEECIVKGIFRAISECRG